MVVNNVYQREMEKERYVYGEVPGIVVLYIEESSVLVRHTSISVNNIPCQRSICNEGHSPPV
jgi:hypothetical protein